MRGGDPKREVYDCDPTPDLKAQISEVEAAFKNFLGIERLSQRWSVPEEGIEVFSPFGTGRVNNFSLGGIGTEFDRYLGRGTVGEFSFGAPESELRRRLTEAGLATLRAEVRWGTAARDGYCRLGLRLSGVTPAQRNFLVEALRSCAKAPASKAA